MSAHEIADPDKIAVYTRCKHCGDVWPWTTQTCPAVSDGPA